VVSGAPAEPDQSNSESPPDSPDQGGVSTELRRAAAEIRDVSFRVSVRGYERAAVDAYVTRVKRLIAELEVTRSPEAAVRHALEQVGEQTRGILERAGETVQEITVAARQEAEERTAHAKGEAEDIVAKAKTEADQILSRSKAEAEATIEQSRKDAAGHLQRTEEKAAALREEAEARMSELHADTEAIRQERNQLLKDIREIAARVEEAASGADARFPPREPAESAEKGVPEHELDAESEQRNVAAAEDSHDGKSSRRVQPGR
jgi:DivIVA domain-containing protein